MNIALWRRLVAEFVGVGLVLTLYPDAGRDADQVVTPAVTDHDPLQGAHRV